jgi:hypothetical protein
MGQQIALNPNHFAQVKLVSTFLCEPVVTNYYWTLAFWCPHFSYRCIVYEHGFIFYCNREIFRYARER